MQFVAHLRRVRFYETFQTMCGVRGVLLQDVFERGRSANVVKVRHEFWTFLRHMGWSFPKIGDLFDRDHTTVLVAVRKAEPAVRLRVA